MGLLGSELEQGTPVERVEDSPVDPGQRLWEPMFNRVLVRPAKRKEKTDSGIYLPDVAQAKQHHGVIVGVGEGSFSYGFFVPTKVKVGQHVIYSKHAGHDIVVNGEDMVLIAETDILARMLEIPANPGQSEGSQEPPAEEPEQE